jgi:hypothetical protein
LEANDSFLTLVSAPDLPQVSCAALGFGPEVFGSKTWLEPRMGRRAGAVDKPHPQPYLCGVVPMAIAFILLRFWPLNPEWLNSHPFGGCCRVPHGTAAHNGELGDLANQVLESQVLASQLTAATRELREIGISA